MPTFQELSDLCVDMRTESLSLFTKFRGRTPRGAQQSAWQASSWSMMRAMTEWRLGNGDPTPFFRDAIGDCRLLLSIPYTPQTETEHTTVRISTFNAIYSQLLLDEPIDEQFRQAIRLPRAFAVAHPQEGWDGSEWDNLVLQLIETGEVPEGFDSLRAWLDARKKLKGTKNHSDTMQAYRQLIEAAQHGDASTAESAIRHAEKFFRQRRNGDATWGGGDVADQTVDIRLSCIIRRVERMSPGLTRGIETPHRWRW